MTKVMTSDKIRAEMWPFISSSITVSSKNFSSLFCVSTFDDTSQRRTETKEHIATQVNSCTHLMKSPNKINAFERTINLTKHLVANADSKVTRGRQHHY